MPHPENLDERLRAVERAVTGDDQDLTEIQEAADHHARFEDLDERLRAVEDRLTDLEAAVQALRGYVGNVRAVNREVERRADAALAAVESLDETDAIDPVPIYPLPERPDAGDDSNSGDSGSGDSDLLDRFREVL